jgi:hypothetical protein
MMKCQGNLHATVVNSNIAIDSLLTLQISLGIVALFEKIYDGKTILTVICKVHKIGLWSIKSTSFLTCLLYHS